RRGEPTKPVLTDGEGYVAAAKRAEKCRRGIVTAPADARRRTVEREQDAFQPQRRGVFAYAGEAHAARRVIDLRVDRGRIDGRARAVVRKRLGVLRRDPRGERCGVVHPGKPA